LFLYIQVYNFLGSTVPIIMKNDFLDQNHPEFTQQPETTPLQEQIEQRQQQKQPKERTLPPEHLGLEERRGWDGKHPTDPHEPIGRPAI
jgi:hypothetical protein